MSKALSLPLNDHGLYKACDILRMPEFPYSKTWLYKNNKLGGSFILPVRKGSSHFYKGKDINEWHANYQVYSATLN